MDHSSRSRPLAALLMALGLAAASAAARPPSAQPLPMRHTADARFALLEHEYVTYVLQQFPVVALKLDSKQASCRAARAAVTRYSRWPTQAISYRLGKEQILQLRRRAQQALGARFSAKRFHLEFMRQGTIPAGYFGDELLRALRSASP